VQCALRTRERRGVTARASSLPDVPIVMAQPHQVDAPRCQTSTSDAKVELEPAVSPQVAWSLLLGQADRVRVPANWHEAHAVFWQHPTVACAAISIMLAVYARLTTSLTALDAPGAPRLLDLHAQGSCARPFTVGPLKQCHGQSLRMCMPVTVSYSVSRNSHAELAGTTIAAERSRCYRRHASPACCPMSQH
jgi:hypothetical protein